MIKTKTEQSQNYHLYFQTLTEKLIEKVQNQKMEVYPQFNNLF